MNDLFQESGAAPRQSVSPASPTPLGHIVVCHAGAPPYLAASILDQHGLLSGPLEIIIAYARLPAALVLVWLFFGNWRAALDDT